eukprot:gene2916-3729_t
MAATDNFARVSDSSNTVQIGPYFAQRVKQRQAELETTAAASKERNRKLLAKIDNIIDHTKEVDGDAARRKAAAQVDASRESYLSTIRRLYPHWKHKVELMTKAQAAAYENAVKASEHRRKQAAKAYEQELEDRSRLMHGHHAALQVLCALLPVAYHMGYVVVEPYFLFLSARQAHEQEGMEEYLRQESRIQLSSQVTVGLWEAERVEGGVMREQAVSAARPSNAPVYYPPKLPSEPTPGAPPEPQTLATLLTSAGPIPYEPPPYPHLPPQQVPFPVANTFQHPGLVNAYGAPGRPGQPPQPQPPGAAQAGPPVSRGLTEKDLQEALAAQGLPKDHVSNKTTPITTPTLTPSPSITPELSLTPSGSEAISPRQQASGGKQAVPYPHVAPAPTPASTASPFVSGTLPHGALVPPPASKPAGAAEPVGPTSIPAHLAPSDDASPHNYSPGDMVQMLEPEASESPTVQPASQPQWPPSGAADLRVRLPSRDAEGSAESLAVPVRRASQDSRVAHSGEGGFPQPIGPAQTPPTVRGSHPPARQMSGYQSTTGSADGRDISAATAAELRSSGGGNAGVVEAAAVAAVGAEQQQQSMSSSSEHDTSQDVDITFGVPEGGGTAEQPAPPAQAPRGGGMAQCGRMMAIEAALEGGAVLSPEDRHSVLEALLHVVYENRYDGAFYDGRQVSPLPAVEGVMHEVQETGELVRTHPEGLLPAQFVRQYLQAKSPPIDTEHAARAAEDAVFHHQVAAIGILTFIAFDNHEEPRAEPVVQAPAKQAAKPGMKDSAGRAPKKGPPLAVFGMGGGGGGGFADAGSSKPASLPSSRRQGGGGGGLVTSIVSKAFADDSDTDMSQSFDELPGPGGNLGQSDEFDF